MGTGTCGHVTDRSNLRDLKDGRRLCPDCMAAVIDELFKGME